MILISIIFCVLAYTIKGGLLNYVLSDSQHEHSLSYLKHLLPAFLILLLTIMIVPLGQAIIFTAAWCYCFASMGEEAGAVGDYKTAWGDYIEKGFGRSYGIKKAIQWGLAWGALMALASGFIWFIPAGAMFPICYFVGSSISAYRGDKGWFYAEPIYSAVIGYTMGVWLNG